MCSFTQERSKTFHSFDSAKLLKMTLFYPKSARFPCENANLSHCACFTLVGGGCRMHRRVKPCQDGPLETMFTIGKLFLSVVGTCCLGALLETGSQVLSPHGS